VPVELPTEFSADRIFVLPATEGGDELRLYTDSGGGLFLFASTVERLRLPVETIDVDGETIGAVEFPVFRSDRWIPEVSVADDDRYQPLRGKLIVMPDAQGLFSADGLLGQTWFGGRRWIFDYPGQKLSVCSEGEPFASDPAHTIPLRFPTNDAGQRGSSFATLDARIDGESLPFLFDTGATLRLGDAIPAGLEGGPGERATSFIVASVFDRWRTGHPDWPVIEQADNGVEHIIEVPVVEIAGHEVGPVWFTRRADPNFHEWMSQLLDRRVEGALGGSLFRFFTLRADYPNGTVSFERR
jgi:hypothetical protein